MSELDFFNDWDNWKNAINESSKMTQKIGKSEVASAKVSAFFARRLYVEGTDDGLLKDLWNVATPQERKALGELLFRVIDKSTGDSKSQVLDEPYGGY